MGDIDEGESMTMAPLVVKDKVIVGNSGGSSGCAAGSRRLDAATGRSVWRAYNTGPTRTSSSTTTSSTPTTKGPGGGPGGEELAAGGLEDRRRHRLGVDQLRPRAEPLYHGTSNPGPWNPELRPGDNKWTATLFARDPDDRLGEVGLPGHAARRDDYDATNVPILVDLPMGDSVAPGAGAVQQERLRLRPRPHQRPGAEAEPFFPLNWATGVNLETGLPQRAASIPASAWTQHLCPIFLGANDQQPAAFSPRTGLFYVPRLNLCMDFEGTEANYISGTPYLGAAWKGSVGPGGYRGAFLAYDAVHGRKVWEIPEDFPVWSGALVTAGDVVFYGTMDGVFKAVDARTGKELWRFPIGSGVVGNPITFRGPDGKQYVAIYAGVGGNAAVPIFVNAPQSAPTGAAGLADVMSDLSRKTDEGGTLYVFELP